MFKIIHIIEEGETNWTFKEGQKTQNVASIFQVEEIWLIYFYMWLLFLTDNARNLWYGEQYQSVEEGYPRQGTSNEGGPDTSRREN